MVNICFLITTYNRQESCQRLVDELQGIGKIIVLNDGCDYKINGCTQIFQRNHYGRVYYYKTVDSLWRVRPHAKYFIMLPDDMLISQECVRKAIQTWESLKDDKKICLNLYADRIGKKCWTGFEPILKNSLWLTQWVDLCFLCEEKFFREVGTLGSHAFGDNPHRSGSGVGAYISIKLHRKSLHLYQVTESLVTLQESHYHSQIHDPKNIGDSVRPRTKEFFTSNSRKRHRSGR